MANEKPVCFRSTFQYCYIRWTVDNFDLISCVPKYELRTPIFSVNYPSVTKWKLGLKSTCTGELGNLSIFLERMETDDGPETVLVNLRAVLLDHKHIECFSSEGEGELQKRKQIELEFLGYPEIHKVIVGHLPDTMNIYCELIVNHDFRSENLHDPYMNPGLLSMVNDFGRLYKRGTFHDAILKVGPCSFRVHRAILSSRNKVMFDCIEKLEPCNNVIVLPEEYADAMSRVLRYFYTGDLNDIVKRPTICLIKLTEYLMLQEFRGYFTGHHLSIKSKALYDEFEFNWTIKKFRENDLDYIASPRFVDDLELHRSWALHLFPRGVYGDSSSMDLIAEYVSGTRVLDVTITYTVFDRNEEIFQENRVLGRIQVTERICALNFLPRHYLDQILRNDEFVIACTIQISRKKMDSQLKSDSVGSHPPPLPIKVFYSGMALNINKLCCRDIHSDVILSADRKNFYAHKGILATRSKTLFSILKKENKFLVSLDMRQAVLAILLKYLYNGYVECPGVNLLKRLYETAIVFSVPCLKALCSEYLRSKFATDTIGDMFEFAENYQDEELKAAVVNYIWESQQNENDQEEVKQE